MCYALATQRFDVLQRREEGRDSKERGEDTSSPLPFAVQGEPCGTADGASSLRKTSLSASVSKSAVLNPCKQYSQKSIPLYAGFFFIAFFKSLSPVHPQSAVSAFESVSA